MPDKGLLAEKDRSIAFPNAKTKIVVYLNISTPEKKKS